MKLTSADLVARARDQIDEIDAVEAVALLDDPNVLFVDIRDVRERHRTGFIPGAFHAPRGMLEFWVDPDSPYAKPIFQEDRKFVFHCASGWRSALTVAALKDMGFDATHITEGFTGWVEAGGPVAKDGPVIGRAADSEVRTVAVLGGSGDLGGGLASRLLRAGYDVVIGSRDAARADAAAQELLAATEAVTGTSTGMDNVAASAAADLVILAVPFASQEETLDMIADAVRGKILVCATVPLVPPKVARVQLPAGGSAGQRAQAQLGEGVFVVSAFQNVAAAHLRSDRAVECDVLVSGDSVPARDTVIEMISACGMTGLHAGPIDNAAAAEALTSVLIGLNKRYKTHAGIRVTGLKTRD